MTHPLPVLEADPQTPLAPVDPSLGTDALRSILEQHRAGDAQAFAKLVTQLSRPIYGYLARTGIPAAERDDLFQEVFLKVHRAPNPPQGPVRAWVLRITVNTVRDYFRRTKVRSIVQPPPSATATAETTAQATDPAADETLRAKETAAFLERQIQALPLVQREALVLASVQGLGVHGAAAVIDEPVETIKTRLRRARAQLAMAMKRRELAAPKESA